MRYRVLLVDENPQDLLLYSQLILAQSDCEVDFQTTEKPIQSWCCANDHYDLIIVSESIPGLNLPELIKSMSLATGVIVVSSRPTIEKAVQAMRSGADDYLAKPLSQASFQLSVRRSLGKSIEKNGCSVISANVGSKASRNLNQLEEVAPKLIYLDDVTGLYNSRYLSWVLDQEIARSETTGKSFAVLFVDVDRFKDVNDRYGHSVGSKLLKELGEHLKSYVRKGDTVFRYGGDEFVAVLSSCDLATARSVAERIRRSVEQKIFLDREEIGVQSTVSIGIALFPDHAKTKREVIDFADEAMYHVKKSTRNSVFVTEVGLGYGIERKSNIQGRYGRC